MKKTIYYLFLLLINASILAQTVNSPNSTKFHNRFVFHGIAESNFGANAVNIGDFNADGIEDLAISAGGENNGEGRVYLYFGNVNNDREPDLIFTPPEDFDGFGYKVASAGDFNGDGFDDFIITSVNYYTQNPAVMVYFGGPSYDTYPDVYLQKYWDVSFFGSDAAGLGDINGDGIGDIGVVTGSSIGIYFGSVNPPTNKPMDAALNEEGNNIEYCGDINGDGYNDILTSNSNTNYAYIYKGGTDFDAEADLFFVSNETDTYFGFQMSGKGDVNGDGLNDILIGEMGINNHVGAAYVYFGATNIFENASPSGRPSDLTFEGSGEYSNYGSCVAIVKDINGDGYDEIAIGGSNLNYLNLFLGGAQIINTPSQIYRAEEEEAFTLISSLDFNGDGYNEIFGGAYEYNSVYMFNNEVKYINAELYDFELSYPSNYYSPTLIGDVNHDGFDDFAFFKKEGLTFTKIKIYLGGGKPSTEAVCTIDCNIPDTSGILLFIKKIGDFNGDGINDFAVNNTIFYGRTDLSQSSLPQTSIVEEGFSVINSGDFNGDSFGDIIIRNNDTNREKVIYGGTNSSEASFRFDIRKVNSTVIDYNGDGIDDYITENYNDVWGKHLEGHLGKISGFRSSSQGIERDFFVMLEDVIDDIDALYGIYPAGDLNNDGFDDFTIYYHTTTGVHYLLSSITEELIELPDLLKKAGDINKDGIDDAYIYGGVYFGRTGLNTFTTLPDIAMNAMSPFGDINGDGFVDFINTSQYHKIDFYFGLTQNIKPNFISVKDVPSDQGGKVTLAWFKSALDGSNVVSYQIERSIAPIGSGYAWEAIGNVSATRNNYYSFTAPTLNDQTPDNNANTYFRITALTDNPDIYYRSKIRNGHSVDNLAPNAVGGLKATLTNEGARVNWKLNAESDLRNYLIYRSTEEEVNFDTLDVYGEALDSVFVDESPLNVSAYYFVRAVDIHSNVGDASSVLLMITGVEETDALPTKFSLSQNYPNPFNPTTKINYTIPNYVEKNHDFSLQHVTLEIFDALGRKIATLVNARQPAGNYSVQFNASKLTSGIYFYTLRAGAFTATKKMILMK